VRREIDGGLLPSCQFALARDGQLAAFKTYAYRLTEAGEEALRDTK
jgi:hypothetical protein